MKTNYQTLISFLLLVFIGYYSFISLMPSASINEKSNETAFSTNNALNQLEEITKKPHFVGTDEHEKVKNYLKSQLEKLGLKVEIQEHVAVNNKWRAAAKTKNIIAKIKGTQNGKALLLLSHYDSNPHSALGASDDGSGVVTILEGVRAFLASGKKPKNDIIICFSDAEELGLLGASAFVNHHPWAKNVGLVLNFEARGSGGPSYMLLETNEGNHNLIQNFQKANTPFPVGNSLMYSIYKMLPNDTDLTVFREEGKINGFNFAFIGDHFDYHTAQDSFERLDRKSLKHQASYLVATLNYFANANLDKLDSQQDDVFFNFPYLGMVYYPFTWVLPTFLCCVVIFIGLLFVGFFTKKISIKGVLTGFVPLIMSLILSGLFSYFGWKLALKIHPQYQDILHGFTYNGYYYIAAFVAITIAICFAVYNRYFKKLSKQDLLIAPLFLWLLINAGVAYYLKGAGFFSIPVVILLVILGVLIFTKEKTNTILLFTFLSLPVIIIFTPLVKMLPVGLGLKMLFVSALLTVLLFGALVPVFQQYKKLKQVKRIFIAVGVLSFVIANFTSNFTQNRKKPNSIFYILDTSKNEAFWASYNYKIDDFTKQFLVNKPIKGSYDANTMASKYHTNIKLYSKAKIENLAKPTISILKDTLINNNRKVTIEIISNRNANKVELLTEKPLQLKSFIINNEPLKNNSNSEYVLNMQKGTILTYYRTSKDEKIILEMVGDKDQKLDMDMLEIKYDLFTNPLFTIKPRTNKMMPMPFVLNDATVIKTNIKL
ncbi:MAG: M20/M25/M40 family metallo-hydrolase [Lutibacter sp.]|uniref:M20/M25/M40 family metallo-hydrolase n=1 Tax=Lutibacter sp. TaxID=1925666 RepID=UPI00299E8886|nr:M20/M25/M40 family metallo-hydrolase [Lutibacter sp.]MDX1830062.1 M20/M25/M40 family metallo-hydrolase [Lutibacter sp.]